MTRSVVGFTYRLVFFAQPQMSQVAVAVRPLATTVHWVLPSVGASHGAPAWIWPRRSVTDDGRLSENV